jgi:hypothetical protein
MAHCPLERFIEGQIEGANFYGADVTPELVEINHLEEDGDIGSVQYTFRGIDGSAREVFRFESSVQEFVRENDGWKQDWDPEDPPSFCEE